MADALGEDNEGFKMLKAMGWKEGSGLGKKNKGSVVPLSESIKEEARREGLGRSREEEVMLAGAPAGHQTTA